jgi:hypothetical protein
MDPGTPAVVHIPPAASFEFDVHVEKAPPKKKLYLISSYIILYLIYILYIYHIYISYIYIYHIYLIYHYFSDWIRPNLIFRAVEISMFS